MVVGRSLILQVHVLANAYSERPSHYHDVSVIHLTNAYQNPPRQRDESKMQRMRKIEGSALLTFWTDSSVIKELCLNPFLRPLQPALKD